MHYRLLTLCLLFLFSHWATTIAQPHQLEPVFPTRGAVNIDPDAPILIRAPEPIIDHSITFNFPDSDQNGNLAQRPTIFIVPSALKDKEDAVKQREQVIGRYRIKDLRTIEFEHGRLTPGTTYTCIVSDVAVASGRFLQALEYEFTTREDVPRIKACTFDSITQISCQSPIAISFSSSLTNLVADPGKIVSLEIIDENNTGVWVIIPSQFNISDNGKVITLSPSFGLTPGSVVRLSCRLSLITGDAADDVQRTTVVRKASKLSVVVSALDGRTVPEWISTQFEHLNQVAIANSPIDLNAPANLGDRWRFARWECDGISIPTAASTTVTIPCDLLQKQIVVRAIVARIDSIQFIVKVDSGGSVNVYNDSGALFKTINTTDTIVINDYLRQPMLMAVPAYGYTFSQWSASSGIINGSTSAAFVIGQAIQNQLSPNNGTLPGFNPKFGGLNPWSETYNLRAVLEDVDANKLFNVNKGVRFTTAKTFESTIPEIRKVCVVADKCWQIVGYAISNSNVVEFFDGVEQFCVEAELTKPENIVTIFAQRKPIFLRVEKVVLKSDDQDDILPNKTTSPESYVKVDLRKIDYTGRPGWVTYSSSTCFDNGIAFSMYEFACGDEIRIRTRGSDVRAELWKFFAEVALYATPSYEETVAGEQRYVLTIDPDIAFFEAMDCLKSPFDAPEIRVRACFRQKFGIEAIGMKIRVVQNEDRGDSRFEHRWYDPLLYRDVDADEPRGSHQLEYIPLHGTQIRVRFTLPIDVRTVYEGGMKARSYGNMLVTDPQAKNLDFEVESFDDEHINFESTDDLGLNTVVFDITDPTTSPRMQALHGGLIDLFCRTSLTSLTGLPLETRSVFILDRMELPGYSLSLKSIDYAYDGDADIWPFENYGEMYLALYGGDLAAHKALMTESAFQRIPICAEQQGTVPDECTIEHSDKHGVLDFGNRLLWIQPYWMDLLDKVWFYGAAYDEDCKDERDCWVNRMAEVIYKVRDRADQYSSTNRSENLNWPSIIPDLIAVGAEFLGTLLTADEQDSYLGQATLLEGADTWWGMTRSTAPLLYANHPNVKITLEGRFYVNKAVLR